MVTMVSPSPTRVPAAIDQARIFQPVRFSGMVISVVAVPSGPTSKEATHKAVSAKFFRMVGCTMSGTGGGGSALPGSSPALSDESNFRSDLLSETPSLAIALIAMGASPPKPLISNEAVLPLLCPLRPCKFN